MAQTPTNPISARRITSAAAGAPKEPANSARWTVTDGCGEADGTVGIGLAGAACTVKAM